MLNRLRWLQIPVSRLSLCIALTGTAFLATTVVAPLPAHAQETAKKKKKKKKTKKGKKGEEAKAGADEAEGDEEEAGAAKADGKADAKAKGDDKPTATSRRPARAPWARPPRATAPSLREASTSSCTRRSPVMSGARSRRSAWCPVSWVALAGTRSARP